MKCHVVRVVVTCGVHHGRSHFVVTFGAAPGSRRRPVPDRKQALTCDDAGAPEGIRTPGLLMRMRTGGVHGVAWSTRVVLGGPGNRPRRAHRSRTVVLRECHERRGRDGRRTADTGANLAGHSLVPDSAATRYLRGGWRWFVLSPESRDVGGRSGVARSWPPRETQEPTRRDRFRD